jgi:pimeloyl-ACP methyl ester carboxylesterase
LDRWLATPGAGFLASAAGLELAGLALGARRVRRRIAAELKLDEDYLEGAGRVLRAPAAWRAFVVEQRALVHELPILESRLSLIAAPATIVIGSRDRIVPPRSARRLSEQIPQAELVVLERAGHLLPLQNASRLAEIVAQASAA